jgi:two-component sensor histidine kinase
VATAHTFRLWLLETVLHQMDMARLQREQAFNQQSLLMAELDHRVKNTLANIQALVRHTKAGAGSLDEFALGLEKRINAMAHAHRLLSNSRWEGASVRSLVEEELAPFRAAKNGPLRISGEDVLLSPAAALSFNLVVHELVTNAAKYGALSTPQGCISIHWKRKDDGALAFSWKESGGPPVTPPSRRGFGSVVIERSLRHELKGASSLRFEPDGVACEITIPAKHLIAHPATKEIAP